MLLSTTELAKHYDIHKNTVYKKVRDGMPVRKIGIKTFRFELEEVDEWFRQNEQGDEKYENTSQVT